MRFWFKDKILSNNTSNLSNLLSYAFIQHLTLLTLPLFFNAGTYRLKQKIIAPSMLSTAKRLKTRCTKRSLVWHVQQKSTKSPLPFYTHHRVCIHKLYAHTRINKEERLAFVWMHRRITTAPYVRKSPLFATMLIVWVFTEF